MRLIRRHLSGFIELGHNAAQLNGSEAKCLLAKSKFAARSPKTREGSPVYTEATQGTAQQQNESMRRENQDISPCA